MTETTAPAATVTSTPSPDSTTILTTNVATQPAGSQTPQGGTPNADPNAAPAANGSTPDPSKATPPAAPVAYDLKIADPSAFDPAAIEAFKKIAAENNLTPEVAQKLVDFQQGLNQQAASDLTALKENWRQESLKELGPNSSAELAHAARFRDQFADKDLVEFLSESGLGNHPAVVRMFVKAGKAIAEDRFVDGKSSAAQNQGSMEARLNRLFPSSAKK